VEFKVSEGVKGLEAQVNSFILFIFFFKNIDLIFIGCSCEKSNIRTDETTTPNAE
jgi:hypothetical protein